MPNTAPQDELLARLSPSWPASWQNVDADSNPLRYEIESLRAVSEAHLPFFRGTAVTWLTVAGNSGLLRSAITGLKAWVIPSFAWEDDTRPIVLPSDYRGPLASPLAQLSPAGYYRWHSTRQAAEAKIVHKLTTWRKLRRAQPRMDQVVQSSLFELREQFQLAISTGDRALAEAALAAIDEQQLDTAANTSFMRTRLRARFRSYNEIVADPSLDTLLALRLPKTIRIAIVEAFFSVYIEDLLTANRSPEAGALFHSVIEPRISPLLSVARHEDGDASRWFLQQIASDQPAPEESPEDRFFAALRRSDWITIQEIGTTLRTGPYSVAIKGMVQAALLESLKYQPDATLAAEFEPNQDEIAPQTWSEFFDAIALGQFAKAERYLEGVDRRGLDLADSDATHAAISRLEEVLTRPNAAGSAEQSVIDRSLPFFIEDLVGDYAFPRPELAASYLLMLQLWVGSRKGSAMGGDSNTVLALSTGTLQCSANSEQHVAGLIRSWWEARPVRANLPFLLSALELLSEFGNEQAAPQAMWIDGVTAIRSRAFELTETEIVLWRRLGQWLGFDDTTVAEYLPPRQATADVPAEDPVSTAGLRKVAIVSLHEKAARAAAKLVAQRTGAEVIVIDELVAGASTQNARSADVILMVWAATKHAVYRAFDDVRDKVAYVQGTGATSIVLGLERWVMHSGAGATVS